MDLLPVVRASFPLAAVAFFSVAVSGGGGLRVNWGALIICLAQSSPAQLSEMRYIPRGLRVDLGQGGVVTWVKDEVHGSRVTKQDVGHVESILHTSDSSFLNTMTVAHRTTGLLVQ